MLTNLHISNIVLIDKLNLEFGAGLSVLTGETGAGKSILLDALSLALGARSDVGLIRHGAESAQVIAEFNSSAAADILSDNEIESDGTIILRRTLSADGKSRAWINDVPVSLKILKSVGDELAEIHGQFESHSLLDPATHIASLDEFGGYDDLRNGARDAYRELHAADKQLNELHALIEKSAAERDFLEFNVRELDALKPVPGEEDALANSRAAMMDAEKNSAILSDAFDTINGADKAMFQTAHILERIKTDPNPYQNQIDKLYEIADAVAQISDAVAPMATDTNSLESIEERLFALRAAARKHRVTVDELPEILTRMREQLTNIDDSESALNKLQGEVRARRQVFNAAAEKLHAARVSAAKILREKILSELPDLKLGGADFDVEILGAAPSATGIDNVTFLIKTNPGTPFAPLHKIASGGELARLMLALRVVLGARSAVAKTFIFDEIDTGISGATAAAVGARLSRLAALGQILVITHSAQVAGHGKTHYLISKNSTDATTTTSVAEIAGDARVNEIARIISGAKITGESVALAKTLIK